MNKSHNIYNLIYSRSDGLEGSEGSEGADGSEGSEGSGGSEVSYKGWDMDFVTYYYRDNSWKTKQNKRITRVTRETDKGWQEWQEKNRTKG